MDCLFCKIINKEIPSKTIYEDDVVFVFLDINPTSNGHMLIVPKKHYENILDLDSNILSHMHLIIKDLYKLLKDILNINGFTIVQNNLYGQEVKHFHIHIIPRYKDDGIRMHFDHNKLNRIDEIFKKIKK